MFKRLTDRLCNVYSMPADELAELLGHAEPVRRIEIVHTYEARPELPEFTGTVLIGEVIP